MTLLPQPPTWIQGRAYSARQDRSLVDLMFTEGVLGAAAGSLAVTQNSLGLDNSVDVAAGRGIVEGDDEAAQGKYLCRIQTFLNVPFGPAPSADARIDLLVLAVNDPTAGSVRTPGDAAVLLVVEGTASSSPAAPAVPATSIPLAEVLRTSGDTTITNAMITDRRSEAAPTFVAGGADLLEVQVFS